MRSLLVEKDVSKFKSLVREHKSANHPLFDIVENLAKEGELTADIYHSFAVNIAARTMFSLPEIHACCIQASLDLDPKRTAYSVKTGAEEGGSGIPEKVHSILMMDALNYHAKVVFNLEPFDLKYYMALIRLKFSANKYKSYLLLKQECLSISEQQLSCFINTKELIDICERCSKYVNIELPKGSMQCIQDVEFLEDKAHEKLLNSGVLQETIDYGFAQLDVLNNMHTGYLQGVGFAHETLADDMIYKMFRIMYAQIDCYSSHKEFEDHVYPYYSGHGNYFEVYNGLEANTQGVEATHGQREFEKLKCLDNEALEVAWIGANDFADRNVKIWDGLLRFISANES